jgi:hypothetical protein
MELLLKQVRVARRRLVLEQWAARFAWSLGILCSIAAVAIVLDRLLVIPVDRWVWSVGWLAGAGAAALLASFVWTYAVRRSLLDAAMEVDARFGLKQRISSTLALGAADRESDAARALVEDAVRHAERIDVAARFGITPSRRVWLSVVPGMIAACAMLLPDVGGQGSVSAQPEDAEARRQVERSTTELQRKLAERRREAEQRKLEDASELLDRVEAGLKRMTEAEKTDRAQALVKLNHLANELQERRQQLAQGEKLRDQLGQMKKVPQGPADRLANAMQQGDMKKALDALDQLKEQLAGDQLSPEARQQLADQLAAMKDKLEQAVQAHDKAREALQQQIDRAQQAGDENLAQQLQEQLDRLNRDDAAMERLQQLADKLGQCSECAASGQLNAAREALDALGADLNQLAQQLEEMELLDQTLDQLAQAKNSMTCNECQGGGCKACQGGMLAQGGVGQRGDPKEGPGGSGPGAGFRPEAEDGTSTVDTRVRGDIGRGASVAIGHADGPNIRGPVRQGIQELLDTAAAREADPLPMQRLPPGEREHVRQYFDGLRK